MMKTNELESDTGRYCFRGTSKDHIVSRPYRRQISGVAYHSQKSRLIPDRPDMSGVSSFPCKVADVSERGVGVVCRDAENAPDLFREGAHMTLIDADGKRARVEVRWVNNGRVGLRRFEINPL